MSLLPKFILHGESIVKEARWSLIGHLSQPYLLYTQTPPAIYTNADVYTAIYTNADLYTQINTIIDLILTLMYCQDSISPKFRHNNIIERYSNQSQIIKMSTSTLFMSTSTVFTDVLMYTESYDNAVNKGEVSYKVSGQYAGMLTYKNLFHLYLISNFITPDVWYKWKHSAKC